MTQSEYLSLKTTLVQGGSQERYALLVSMTQRQRQEFTRGLTLSPADHLEMQTWKMLAILLAQDSRDQLNQIDGPALCADPFNGSCECVPCEMKEAASGELAAPTATVEDFHRQLTTGDFNVNSDLK